MNINIVAKSHRFVGDLLLRNDGEEWLALFQKLLDNSRLTPKEVEEYIKNGKAFERMTLDVDQ